MKLRVVVLGAGFGGLELSTVLSDAIGEDLDLTLIDKSDSFVFGYSKLDVMFGRKTSDSVRLAYRNIGKPGVRFRPGCTVLCGLKLRRFQTRQMRVSAKLISLRTTDLRTGSDR